jgi:hypothetical protein
MTRNASEGIFYVVRYPSGWNLLVNRFEGSDGIGHPQWWEATVAALVAAKWARRLKIAPETLEQEILLLTYAFPRGRVTKVRTTHRICYGADLDLATYNLMAAVEDAFNIKGRLSWAFDEHEQCLMFDKEEMRRILHLREDWKAV